MPTTDFHSDADALAAFVEDRSEGAFNAIVERYADMVYGAALRKSGSPQLAEEAAQNVFALLARKAGALRSSKALGTWLHRATILETRNLMRGESNHRRKMQRYSQNIEATDGGWDDSAPELDEAINKLPEADRRMILLRFYNGLSFKEIGEQLGASDDTCQKRTSRALEKLSAILRQRGAAIPAAVIAGGLAAKLTVGAPAALKATLAESALATGATTTATTSSTVLNLMACTNWKLAAAAVIAASIPLSLQWSQNLEAIRKP